MKLNDFFDHQIQLWNGRGQLETVETRQLTLGSRWLTLQHNPARIVSTGAKIDAASISYRKCFLCPDGRLENQIAQQIELAGEGFDILVNPYPILPYHFTIAARRHCQQQIAGRTEAFAELLEAEPQLTVFYNGPQSGASAPDHLHLQASLQASLPLQKQWHEIVDAAKAELQVCHFLSPFYAIETASAARLTALINKTIAALPILDGDYEPRLNIIAWHSEGTYKAAIIPRQSHRPDCYNADGDEKRLVSPGALDMAGLIITPRRTDFDLLTTDDIARIMSQCGGNAAMPLSVGIMHQAELQIRFNGQFFCKGQTAEENERFCFSDGQISWRGESHEELLFVPQNAKTTFTLAGVEIGTQFHWQQQQEETFCGSLRIIVSNGELIAINIVNVETYLESVVGSEMSATSPEELLKAHAVISRSWVMAQIMDKNKTTKAVTELNEPNLHLKWYDHDAHTLFDVCADDHCQRYQGIPQKESVRAAKAVSETRGEVLTYEGEIADARFSKCCGGATEQFSCCWADTEKPYLIAREDSPSDRSKFRPLHAEEDAQYWILRPSKTFCGMADKEMLKKSLNGYDQTTTDFYRWNVRIEQEELQKLLREKIGFDGGAIKDLIPLERGTSGRISLLRIVATNDFIDIGKELEIRRALSPTHLLSSAFIVEPEYSNSHGLLDLSIPSAFVLYGAGWGHGVGLCQIGAAQMASMGYDYRQILMHYYSCEIEKIGTIQ